MRPLSLTDRQLALVHHAARSLHHAQRNGFLQDVSRHLADEPSDNAVAAAISIVLARTPISAFLCKGKKKESAI